MSLLRKLNRTLRASFDGADAAVAVEPDEPRRKMARLDLGATNTTESVWRIVFELTTADHWRMQLQAQQLLDEVFHLTFDCPVGQFSQRIGSLALSTETIVRAFPYRQSIFNSPLQSVSPAVSCPVTSLPKVIIELMRELCQSDCLCTVGAFRIEAEGVKLAPLEAQIELGHEVERCELKSLPPVVKMTLLKRYFRSIPGQLVNNTMVSLLFLVAQAFEDSPCAVYILRWLLSCLPLENFKALGMLCLLLNAFAKHAKFNMMTAESLAICWGPVVFDFDMDLQQIRRLTELMTLFITKWDQFFLLPQSATE